MTPVSPKKPVLGIVGGIGSGKSAVAAELARLGGHLIDADKLGHEALRQPDIYARIVSRWGDDILDDAGQVNRRALGRKVFADPAERRELEELLFPWIERRIREEIDRGQQDPQTRWIILDAAIMMETGWDRVCDKILFVDGPREVRLGRLQAGRGWTEQELDRRERSQMPLEEKHRRADAVVVNDRDLEGLKKTLLETLSGWGWYNQESSHP